MVSPRVCATCRHYELDMTEEQCKTCIYDFERTKWEPRAKQIRLEKRPTILPEPLPIYEHVDSEIPERIRISFTNGTSAVYDLHVDQPAPQVIESIKIIRRMKQGYINQPPMRRRNRK